jgi:hypothetical protein
MSDGLNSQGSTQAAVWNRFLTAAWGLTMAIAICSYVLVGYGGRSIRAKGSILFVLPLFVSITFLVISASTARVAV